MTDVFISDTIISNYERTAEVFFPDRKLCVKARLDADHDKGSICLTVTLSGIDSNEGKIYREVHAARFLKYVATSLVPSPRHLTQVAQSYIMIYAGKIDILSDTTTDEWLII